MSNYSGLSVSYLYANAALSVAARRPLLSVLRERSD